MKLLLYILIFTFISCASGQKNTAQVEIPFEILAEGSHGGYSNKKEIVIRDKKELRQIYTQINMFRKPGIPLPSINFEKEMVIALFLGKKTSGGYSISIHKIYENKDKIEIIIANKKPNGITSMALTQPFYFCKLPRKEKIIVFKNVE